MTQRPTKKQKRDHYRATLSERNEGDATTAKLPQKKHFRQRAHANPFSDHSLIYPVCPQRLDLSEHYPAVDLIDKQIDIADIGCGFGGLLFALGPRFPDSLAMGMEIRTSVTQFVHEKIKAVRLQSTANIDTNKSDAIETKIPDGYSYQNLAVLRANTMKFLPNFFPRASLAKIFLCFPDPHFKARKHKARIVSATLTAEYAYAVRPGGIVYTITDVKDLHEWMKGHLEACPLFEKLTDEELAADECVAIMSNETEESKKVTRNGGMKYVVCFRRKEDPAWPADDGDGEVDLYA